MIDNSINVLLDASKSLVTSLDYKETLQATVDSICKLANLESAAIYELNEDTLRLCATAPPLPPDFPEILREAHLIEHPRIQQAIDTASSVYIADILTVPLTSWEQKVVSSRNLRTLLYLPLIAENEAMGALIVGSTNTPKPISPELIIRCSTLANIAALALKNARLFLAKEQYARKLEKMLAEREVAEQERLKLQEQLIQSQKMDAIGKLAGGIAHDFNNQLGGIMGFAELLLSELTSPKQQEFAKNIILIASRSADLTAQLLAFSRKGQIQKVSLDLHAIIDEVIGILQRTIRKNISIETQLAAMIHQTNGDPSQIQSALLNLAVNARDAMPNGGSLRIETKNIFIDNETQTQQTFKLISGSYILLTISDTGIGMDNKTLTRIYEPFFTTKKPGAGTGMGLSAVYGTMKTHGGAIHVYSELGQGTTFKLFFPMMTSDDRLQSPTQPLEQISSLPPTNIPTERIVIVDDETMVAEVAAAHLEGAGFDVKVFQNSLEALEYIKNNVSNIALLILDMIMPHLDGPALYREVRQIDSEIPIILSSGFSIDGAAQELLNSGALAFIQKPFRRSNLMKTVKSALKSD